MNIYEDTIVALSTPVGTGGIAVIRVSGRGAIEKTALLFKSKIDLKNVKSHTAHFGYFFDKNTNEKIDQVVLTIFKNPNSFTGEDVVEISCHGGKFVSSLILQNLLSLGLRLAEPGEFTKRAFLNGKMDLAQAEAVADLIQAKTQLSLGSAVNQLQDGYSKRIQSIQDKIINMVGNLEIELDFGEENIVLKTKEELLRDIEKIIFEQDNLIKTYQKGKLIRDGVKVVLTGKPNVGKSSLFNAILGYERAIVDETPGTTRDAIEAQLDIDGTFYRLIDTAGLRDSSEKIEQKGIGIAEAILENVDLILLLIDASSGPTDQDEKIIQKLKKIVDKKEKSFKPDILYVLNKIDLVENKNGFAEFYTRNVQLSAKTGEGLKLLHNFLAEFVINKDTEEVNQGQIITNIRHYNLLQKSNELLQKSKKSLTSGFSNEFIALDLRAALDFIGEIIGKTTTDDILNHVFENFCIGK
jgi:tRNA modification GTPase